MTLDEARRRLDKFFATQTNLDVLMLSGGEPTVHPEFKQFLDMALEYPVQRVLINTNGLAIAKRPEIVEALKTHRKRIELYFSFSTFREENHQHFYGADLRDVKRRALEVASEAGLFTTLVVVVERGVNDDELGELYRFGLSQPTVTGLSFQPAMTAGRYEHSHEAANRATTTDTLHWLEQQTGGDLLSSDFVALPCSHPDCCTLTYGFLDKDRLTMRPLTRTLDVRRYLELFSDRISFDGMIGKVARRVWSDVTNLRAGQTLRDLAALFRRGGMKDAMWVANDPEAFGRRVFRVVVKPFMDANTYDAKRVEECCTKILTEGGGAVSFCEYNVLHRPVAGRKTIPLQLVVR
jgi:uncharacterized radical SAM superfamily Fe-S cluster-containing enzyme